MDFKIKPSTFQEQVCLTQLLISLKQVESVTNIVELGQKCDKNVPMGSILETLLWNEN